MLKNRPQLRQYLQVTSWYFDGLILSRFVKFNLLQAKSTLPANNLNSKQGFMPTVQRQYYKMPARSLWPREETFNRMFYDFLRHVSCKSVLRFCLIGYDLSYS